jgi:DNA-binding NtrC family response regulator
MQDPIATLIVSGRVENRKELSRILSSPCASVFIVGTLAHAREVLQVQPIAVVFCDEWLSDGSYRDLVSFAKDVRKNLQFIVMLSTGESREFLEALGLGADVIRYPLQSADVELALRRAIRRRGVANESRLFATEADLLDPSTSPLGAFHK